MNFMAEKSAGRDWKTFNDEQKQQWIEAFSDHTLANYASRFKGFSGQNFETHGEEEAASHLAQGVKDTLGFPTTIPRYGDCVELV